MKELSEKEALYKAAAYCSSSEHCLSEVADKLDGWGVSPAVKESILQYLLKRNILMKTVTVVALSVISSGIISGGRTKLPKLFGKRRYPKMFLTFG